MDLMRAFKVYPKEKQKSRFDSEKDNMGYNFCILEN
jgi:hypothetical protein